MMTPGLAMADSDSSKQIKQHQFWCLKKHASQKLEKICISSLPVLTFVFFVRNCPEPSGNIQHFIISSQPLPPGPDLRLLIASREAMDEIHYSEFEHPNFDAKVSWLQKSQHGRSLLVG